MIACEVAEIGSLDILRTACIYKYVNTIINDIHVE